jgi:hypothetical protein
MNIAALLTAHPAALACLGVAVLAAAAVAAVAAPRLLRAERARLTSAVTFAASIIVSLGVVVLTMQHVGPTHAGGWLAASWLFAQLVVAGTLLVARTHEDADLPRSTWSAQGYAALSSR